MKKFIKTSLVVAIAFGFSAAFSQVAVVVSAKSTATAMTNDQAAALFLGKSDQIPGVGTALLLDQSESSAVREQFYSKVAGKSGSQVKAAWSRLVFSGKATPPKEIATSAEVKKMVANNANAIGYIEKSAVDASVKVLLTAD
jgi:ABC-type phosphate transport system substrate-binding protein